MLKVPRNLLRRVYDYAALLAVLNVLVFGGLVLMLVSGGALSREKAADMIRVMRGEPVTTVASQVSAPMEEEQDAPLPVVPSSEASLTDLEILRLEAQRIKTELEQRLALNNSILLRVTAEREAFQREREETKRIQQASMAERRQEGFAKQVAIYESLSPRVAVEHLLSMDDPDEAARVLLDIETRKARKIVEAARTPDQVERMKIVLRRLREVAPDRSVDFEDREGV